jgi:hypothetical protein
MHDFEKIQSKYFLILAQMSNLVFGREKFIFDDFSLGGAQLYIKSFSGARKINLGQFEKYFVGAFRSAVKNGFTQRLHCILCLAENAVGNNAMRPDDIITLYSGKTVEVNNTDAEGRLVLGDGVSYATKDLKADIVLDMATLTGTQNITTGKASHNDNRNKGGV